jgi:hypothetical protein
MSVSDVGADHHDRSRRDMDTSELVIVYSLSNPAPSWRIEAESFVDAS